MRIFCFIGITLAALFLPFWIFVCLAFLYALVWIPYELLALALAVDAQFGDASMSIGYAYTLASALALVLAVYTRPYLRFYS